MYPNHHPTVPLNPSSIVRPNPGQDTTNYDGGRHSVFPYMVPNRSNFNPFQIFHMEQVFNNECRPSRHVLEILSEKVNIPLKNVQIWFQNRRARARKKGEQLNSKNLKSIDSRNIYYNPQLQSTVHLPSPSGFPNTPISDSFYSSTGYPILPMPTYEQDKLLQQSMVNSRMNYNNMVNQSSDFQYRKNNSELSNKPNQFLPNSSYSGSSISDSNPHHHPSSFQMTLSGGGGTSQPSLNYYNHPTMPPTSDIRYMKPFQTTDYQPAQPLTSPLSYHPKQSLPFTQDQINSHFITKMNSYNHYQTIANQSKADDPIKTEPNTTATTSSTMTTQSSSTDPTQVNSLHPILSTMKPPYSHQQLLTLFGTLPPSSQIDPSISHQGSDCPSTHLPYDSPSGPIVSSGPGPILPAVSAS